MACAGVFALLAAFSVECMGAEADEAAVPIRIGWQMPTVTQAALVQVLKRTDVLARHGLEPNLIPFSYGTPEVQAALAGKLDAFFAGDQPAINLLANGGKWKIVARVYYDRVAVIVPPNSPIKTIADLKDKTVASPFGSIAHREAFLEQRATGLDPDKDVRNENMDSLEIRRRVLGGGVASWEGIDAAAVWEPDASSFQLEGHTRNLTDTPALGVVAISDEFISGHPEAAVQFLVALVRAWDYFVRNTDRIMEWYNDDTHLGYSPEALIKAVKSDPNFDAKSLYDINLELNGDLVAILEKNAAWGVDAWEDGREIRQFIDQELLARATREIAAAQYDDLQVILPSIREVALDEAGEDYGLDAIPLLAVFVFMVLIALLAIETGFWFGRRGHKKHENDPVRPIATVVGAVLGMMAFVIALTFGSASNRFDARKAALLEDVTAIQTAYLRADLLPEPQRTTVRSLLRDYVQVRVGIVYAYGQPERLKLIQRRAEALQESMWSRIEDLAEANGDSKIHVFFASTLNDVFNLHTKRVVLGAHYRIPDFVWWALIFASSVAMVAVGFQFGVGGGRRIHTANFSLAVTFALVMLLAFDLDRAGEGLVAVNQQPMIDLYRSLSTRR
jgi:ABC-type nitrate/sulfonate/bicarbonate transport system substrate-binding protein